MLELFIYMQVSPKEINTLIICITLVFFLAPVSLLVYVAYYNRRKKDHRKEKELMRLTFESELVKTQLEVQEQTMQTIGADLHDNIGQLLSLTALTLNSIDITDPERSQQKVADAIGLTSRSIKEMRVLGKLLQGEQLVDLGLEKAIQYEVDWLVKAGQFDVIYRFEGSRPASANINKELILFRMLQEIMNNGLKHSGATQMTIDLAYLPDSLRLEVTDNGVGFDSGDDSAQLPGMGLHNIRKRSTIIGASLQIDTAPGEGTKIKIIIPYP